MQRHEVEMWEQECYNDHLSFYLEPGSPSIESGVTMKYEPRPPDQGLGPLSVVPGSPVTL